MWPCRQSLVTPIDWKHQRVTLRSSLGLVSRQSLVTPIDWKPVARDVLDHSHHARRQSLVTPIDWKHFTVEYIIFGKKVANPW